MIVNIVIHEHGGRDSIMELVFSDKDDPVDYKPFNEIAYEIAESIARSHPSAYLFNLLDVRESLDGSSLPLFILNFPYDRLNFRFVPCSVVAQGAAASWWRNFISGWPCHDDEPILRLCESRDEALGYLRVALNETCEKRRDEDKRPLRFFPEGILIGNEQLDTFRVNWYSAYLTAMEEPPFHEHGQKRTYHGYRFLYLPSFHSPVCIRLEVQPDNSGLLIIKKLPGAGGYIQGRLVVNESRRMSAGSVAEFLKILKEAGYWSLAAQDERTGLDGAQWIIEGVKMANYHFVDRWSPRHGKFREAALYLWKESGLPMDEID